jgi:hypothetical protein
MWDKTYTYVLMLFIFVGILAYERHIINQGGMGIASRIVDYVGIADYDDPHGETTTSFAEKYTFDFKNLERLKEKYHAIESQRTDLVEHREEILQAIDDLNPDIYQEAVLLKDAIFQERDELFTSFPEIPDFATRLTQAKEEVDPVVQQQLYDSLESDILAFLVTIVDDPMYDILRLQNLFSSTETLINDFPDVLIARCVDIDLEECLKTSTDLHADLTEMIMTIATGPDQQLVENFVYFLNIEHMEQTRRLEKYEFEESDEEIDSEFKRLIKLLDDVQEKDLFLLEELHDTLEKDQEILMFYLKRNQKLAVQRYKDAYRDVVSMRLSLSGVSSSGIRSRVGSSLNGVSEKIERQEDAINALVFKIDINNQVSYDRFEKLTYQRVMSNVRVKDTQNMHNKESQDDFVRHKLQGMRDLKNDLGY